jgi:hypothetical protein
MIAPTINATPGLNMRAKWNCFASKRSKPKKPYGCIVKDVGRRNQMNLDGCNCGDGCQCKKNN